MNLHKRLSVLLFALVCYTASSQEKLVIEPALPERGQQVTITYNPKAPGATIPDTVTSLTLVFTYSNLYEQPWKYGLRRVDDRWQVSFMVPPYGTYATFYLQSGDYKDQPGPKKHYELAVYEKGRRVKNGYLYEGYSLSAQTGRIPDLEARKAALFAKELEQFPDNYEAKLRLLTYKIAIAPTNEKEQLRKQAREIIAKKFMENPGNMGLLNSTTMGYLIIGENSRLDSIRNVVVQKFPETQAGYELRIADIKKDADTNVMVSKLLAMLKKENPSNANFLKEAHETLFEYYASKKRADKALFHLAKLGEDNTPYRPRTLKQRAEVLVNAGLAPDTAWQLLQRAYALADTFPAGLIRYFPETGHLPAYVDPETRARTTATARGNLLSLMALVKLLQNNTNAADSLVIAAARASSDVETMFNTARFYEQRGVPEKAFAAYKTIMYQKPEDTIALSKMKQRYLDSNTDAAGLQKHLDELNAHWKKEMTAQLNKEIIKLKAPSFLDGIVDLKGQRVPAELIKNKIVVIDFWATWCVPCMHEMPYVQNAYEKYKDDKNVLFMILNSGSNNTLEDAVGWWGNKKYTFPVFYNKDRTIGDKFGFNVIPATYILDTAGDIRFKTIGFEGPVIQRKIEAAIELLKK
ncbi:TlpA family protein disulfide reductase [Segetibacter sp. 3557_3]|uniref:TlpA disulfide reductase family protein n=1 Tax=Segetibacter sp. 3557_3 TaxID=2547429 RepID=UPI001058917A|nr:TlpA disulfide reductase family protein [Segetibacter sp. 3557_3]TDH21415.1 TlpA family protein disulfide reductase [Segetibacter sp. 3557_3]